MNSAQPGWSSIHRSPKVRLANRTHGHVAFAPDLGYLWSLLRMPSRPSARGGTLVSHYLVQSTILAILAAVAGTASAQTPIVLQTSSLRLEVNPDGMLRRLADVPGGVEYLGRPGKDSFAGVYRGGQWVFPARAADDLSEPPTYCGGQSFPATAVTLADGVLTVRFDQADATAHCRIAQKERYLTFELLELTGKPVDHIDIVRLPLRPPARLGAWINVAHDDRYAICLCAGNVRTDAGMEQHADDVVLRATAEPRVTTAGAVAVLFGCPRPQEQFLDYMETVERDLGMPPGCAGRRWPILAEDVHVPLWYHIANAQYRVWKRLVPAPPIAETAATSNFSWHMMTRGVAFDIIAPAEGMKDFCDLMPCRAAAARTADFCRIEFGWLGRFGSDLKEFAGPQRPGIRRQPRGRLGLSHLACRHGCGTRRQSRAAKTART